MVALRLKGLLDENMSREVLSELSSAKIDEIVSRMKSVKDKTVTEQGILKLEARYNKDYLEPARKTLEENMKTLLRAFTRRIFGVLDGAGLVKEGPEEQGKTTLNIDLSTK